MRGQASSRHTVSEVLISKGAAPAGGTESLSSTSRTTAAHNYGKWSLETLLGKDVNWSECSRFNLHFDTNYVTHLLLVLH